MDTIYATAHEYLRCVCDCAEFVQPVYIYNGLRKIDETVIQCSNCRSKWRRRDEPFEGGFEWYRVEAR